MNLDEMITQIEADYECAGYSTEEIDKILKDKSEDEIKKMYEDIMAAYEKIEKDTEEE